MGWSVARDRLSSGSRVIQFENDIDQFSECEGKLVVVLDWKPSGVVDTRNVVCVTDRGEHLWRIEGIDPPSTDSAHTLVGIIRIDPRVVVVASFACIAYEVDMTTGRRLRSWFTKQAADPSVGMNEASLGNPNLRRPAPGRLQRGHRRADLPARGPQTHDRATMHDTETTLWEPSRAEGLARLADFAERSGREYADRRNYDLGPGDRTNVSTLSPYLRHRLVTEAEVARAALDAHGPRGAERFLQEVGWRTYWKGWLELRPQVWRSYLGEVQAELDRLDADPALRERYDRAIDGRAGIKSFDAWARELVEVGYLHNHARMWFASIWIFTLELPWALGADFFLRHLLCGDPASNTLSWRWVAGIQTRGKTYQATAENIAKFTEGRFKPKEPLATDLRMVDVPKPPAAGPLPKPGRVDPARPFGLLLTEDDLHPEDYDLPRPQIRGVAGLSGEAGRCPGPVAARVVEFTRGALDDGLSRAAAHFEVPNAGRLDDADWADALAGWARSLGVDQVVVPHVPVGPSRDRLDPAAEALAARHDIHLVRVRREWDDELWPLATAGYFPFREKLLGRLPRLAGPDGR